MEANIIRGMWACGLIDNITSRLPVDYYIIQPPPHSNYTNYTILPHTIISTTRKYNTHPTLLTTHPLQPIFPHPILLLYMYM